MEIVNEIGGILYWVWESEMDLEFIHKKYQVESQDCA